MGCHFLLQGIFPTQGSNLHFLHCSQILHHWATRGTSPRFRGLKSRNNNLVNQTANSVPPLRLYFMVYPSTCGHLNQKGSLFRCAQCRLEPRFRAEAKFKYQLHLPLTVESWWGSSACLSLLLHSAKMTSKIFLTGIPWGWNKHITYWTQQRTFGKCSVKIALWTTDCQRQQIHVPVTTDTSQPQRVTVVKAQGCPQMSLQCICVCWLTELSYRRFRSTGWSVIIYWASAKKKGGDSVRHNSHPLEIISLDFIKLEELHLSFTPSFSDLLSLYSSKDNCSINKCL